MHSLRLYSFALSNALNCRPTAARQRATRKRPARTLARRAPGTAASRVYATLSAVDYCAIGTRGT